MRPSEIAQRLDGLGFYATANDTRAGRIWTAEIVHRLRRDAPKRRPENRNAAIALADVLETALRKDRR